MIEKLQQLIGEWNDKADKLATEPTTSIGLARARVYIDCATALNAIIIRDLEQDITNLKTKILATRE